MVSPGKLRILVELARLGTLRAVADLLAYSPSSVSWQLAELEREAGVPLVTRVGRRLALTEAGTWLAQTGARILDDLDSLEHSLAHYQDDPAGPIRLAVFPTAGHDLVVPMLQDMSRRYPRIDVSVVEREPAQAVTDLATHDVDVAVACEYSLAPLRVDGSLVKSGLLTEEVFLALRSGDPLVSGNDDIPVSALEDRIWLAGEPGSDDTVLAERLCALGGYHPLIKHAILDYRLMLALVAAGFGIGFVPQMALGQAPPGVTFRRCRDARLWRHVLLVNRSGADKHPALQAIAAALRASIPGAQPPSES